MIYVTFLSPLLTCAGSFMGGEDDSMGGGLITRSTARAGLGTGLTVERSMWIMWMNVWAGNRQMVWLVERAEASCVGGEAEEVAAFGQVNEVIRLQRWAACVRAGWAAEGVPDEQTLCDERPQQTAGAHHCQNPKGESCRIITRLRDHAVARCCSFHCGRRVPEGGEE